MKTVNTKEKTFGLLQMEGAQMQDLFAPIKGTVL